MDILDIPNVSPRRRRRMLLKQLQNVNRRVWGATRSGGCPEDEITDPEPEPRRTNLNKPERVQLAIPSKTLEIAPPTAPEKNLPEHLDKPLPPTAKTRRSDSPSAFTPPNRAMIPLPGATHSRSSLPSTTLDPTEMLYILGIST